ncbi:MAG: 5-formyltetrahydrofolate cyclo-ligase [Rhodospirillales bacterium]|nr:MAG: 5-formyltetrahydrofolate cyclo-ligase [Rhodospirillales bacterium]
MRATMLARRAAFAPDARASAAAALIAIWDRERPVPTRRDDGAATVMAGFWSMGDEIDVRPLLARLSAEGYAIALPVTPARGAPLTFRAWSPGAALLRGPMGTSQPGPEAAIVEPDALLVPLLAFDDDGYRLGYGGGYYDRTLAALRARRAVTAIGVGFEAQRVDAVPRGPGDGRLDWLLTERAMLAFA